MTDSSRMSTFSLVPCLSYGQQPSLNLLIEGENQQVLALLSAASIDLIYTDPPYGTEKQFRYNDRWKKPRTHPEEEMYVTEREAGSHANWINFMASRICLMKRLLKPSGIIAISIGVKQLFYLGLLLDDLFGEKNRLGIINWQKTYAPKNDAKHIADTTDYVLVYVKDRKATRQPSLSGEQQATMWGADDPLFDENRLKIGDVPLDMLFPPSWYEHPFKLGSQAWRHEQSGHTQDATKLLNAIMGGGNHNATPKPLLLIEKLIQLWCPPDGTILDAFAGSGTTGHAVLNLNTRLHTERRFILIEQGNLPTGDLFARTLTAERLRRVITGQWANGQHLPLGGGYTFSSIETLVTPGVEEQVAPNAADEASPET